MSRSNTWLTSQTQKYEAKWRGIDLQLEYAYTTSEETRKICFEEYLCSILASQNSPESLAILLFDWLLTNTKTSKLTLKLKYLHPKLGALCNMNLTTPKNFDPVRRMSNKTKQKRSKEVSDEESDED